ncbi:MAG: hypothetical protein RR319_01255 [Bacteroides sp.]
MKKLVLSIIFLSMALSANAYKVVVPASSDLKAVRIEITNNLKKENKEIYSVKFKTTKVVLNGEEKVIIEVVEVINN